MGKALCYGVQIVAERERQLRNVSLILWTRSGFAYHQLRFDRNLRNVF
jgi:hypothetical protein